MRGVALKTLLQTTSFGGVLRKSPPLPARTQHVQDAITRVVGHAITEHPRAALHNTSFFSTVLTTPRAIAHLAPLLGSTLGVGGAIVDPARLLMSPDMSARVQAPSRWPFQVVQGGRHSSSGEDAFKARRAWQNVHMRYLNANASYRYVTERVVQSLINNFARNREIPLLQSMIGDTADIMARVQTLCKLDHIADGDVYRALALMVWHDGKPLMTDEEAFYLMAMAPQQRAVTAVNLMYWKSVVLAWIVWNAEEVGDPQRRALMHSSPQDRAYYGSIARDNDAFDNDECKAITRFLTWRSGVRELGTLAAEDMIAARAVVSSFTAAALASPIGLNLRSLRGPLTRGDDQIEHMITYLNTGVFGLAPEEPMMRHAWMRKHLENGLSSEWICRMVKDRYEAAGDAMQVATFMHIKTPFAHVVWNAMDAQRPWSEVMLHGGANAIYGTMLPGESHEDFTLRQILGDGSNPRARRKALAEHALNTDNPKVKANVLRMLRLAHVGGHTITREAGVVELLKGPAGKRDVITLDLAHINGIAPDERHLYNFGYVRVARSDLERWVKMTGAASLLDPRAWNEEEWNAAQTCDKEWLAKLTKDLLVRETVTAAPEV